MPLIYQLPLQTQVSGGDQFAVYSPNTGDARRLPVSALLAYFQQTFAAPTLATNVYTPGTGFSIAVPTPVSQQQWMLLQPAGTLASGTVVLPLNTSTPDGTEVLITSTQIITTFTLNQNGSLGVNGAPTTLAANGFARVRYVQSQNRWYRIA